MNWQEYQNNDRGEQEQLENVRAQIEDATKDTIVWLQDDPSAEERVHVLAVQMGLANLARIVERRMERRELPKDEWEYSETVSHVLSRLDKARKLRGNNVGKDSSHGLARLAECLPKKLPGLIPAPVRPLSTAFKVTRRVPAPPTSVGGLGITLTREPKPTQVPDLPSYYPNDLKSQTRLIVVEAVRKLPYLTQTSELCKYIFSELTPHVREAVQAREAASGPGAFPYGSPASFGAFEDDGEVRL